VGRYTVHSLLRNLLSSQACGPWKRRNFQLPPPKAMHERQLLTSSQGQAEWDVIDGCILHFTGTCVATLLK